MTEKLSLARRISTSLIKRAVWQFERKRPYAIRDRVFTFPHRNTAHQSPAANLVIQTTPNSINNAAWTAYSLLIHLSSPLSLTFVIDSDNTAPRHADLQRLFPDASILYSPHLVHQVRADAPSVAQLASYHPMGRKIATLWYLQQQGPILFSDDDILAFERLEHIDASISQHPLTALYLDSGDHVTAEEPSIAAIAREQRLDWVSNINVGLMYLPQGTLPMAMVESLLNRAGKIETWFPDTMLLAIALKQVSHAPLPVQLYVTNVQRQFWGEPDVDYSSILLRHYVTPVRPLMYIDGMPRVETKIRALTRLAS